MQEPVGGLDFNIASVHASTTTTGAGVGVALLGPQSGRKHAVITNTGGTIAYLAFTTASTTAQIAAVTNAEYVIPLTANGGSYTINELNLYKGRIVATSSAAVILRAMEIY